MRNKRSLFECAGDRTESAPLRNRIRLDLARLGLADELSETLARKLEPTVAKLSDEESAAVLSSVAAAYGEPRQDADAHRINSREIADVQRLMHGFREEVQKLDEGLRVLSAYVSRLRQRSTPNADETLH
jgi:hypothetical protein